MSLLDDVSIVVTPNGYKAGELYAVIPVPTEGAELVEDGSFPSGTSNWSEGTGWSLTDGYANASSASGELSQSGIDFDTSKRYYIQYTISGYSGSGGVKARFKGAVWNTGELREENGTFTEVLMSTAENNVFSFVTSSSFTGSISNVSVKEYTSADMDVTRATDATRVNESGLIEDVLANVPRIDYTGGGCPHILAEPMRTNLVTNSTNVNGYFTSQIDATLTNDYGTSPTGENNSTRVQWADSTSFIYRAESVSTDTSASIFVKGTSGETVMFGFGGNVTTGDIYTFDGSWQRIIFTGSAGTTIFLSTYGGATATDFEVFGLQVEVGSYATSYIPTSGSTVTRNQDIFTRDGIGSLINSTEGVLFVEAATFENGADCRITLSDGTITNRVSIEWDILANTIKGFVGSDGNLVSPATYNQTDYNKIAIKYKENDCALWINGTEVDTDFAVSVLSGVNQLEFSNYGGSLTFEGKVKQLQVYDTALTDEQLEALTT